MPLVERDSGYPEQTVSATVTVVRTANKFSLKSWQYGTFEADYRRGTNDRNEKDDRTGTIGQTGAIEAIGTIRCTAFRLFQTARNSDFASGLSAGEPRRFRVAV